MFVTRDAPNHPRHIHKNGKGRKKGKRRKGKGEDKKVGKWNRKRGKITLPWLGL